MSDAIAPGRSRIHREIHFDPPMPEGFENKKLNMLWNADEFGTMVRDVGFRADLNPAGGSDPALCFEEFWDVAGTPAQAQEIIVNVVHPRIRQLFSGTQSGDVQKPVAGPESGKDTPTGEVYLAPSVAPLEKKGKK